MIKEYKIGDILNAIDKIQKIKKKANKLEVKKNDLDEKNDILTLNKQAKPSKSEILVLNQMIE
tara:strand:+ start:384 stop:572 length:189 start_codon:yes stop_codon:yes gene_type:complete